MRPTSAWSDARAITTSMGWKGFTGRGFAGKSIAIPATQSTFMHSCLGRWGGASAGRRAIRTTRLGPRHPRSLLGHGLAGRAHAPASKILFRRDCGDPGRRGGHHASPAGASHLLIVDATRTLSRATVQKRYPIAPSPPRRGCLKRSRTYLPFPAGPPKACLSPIFLPAPDGPATNPSAAWRNRSARPAGWRTGAAEKVLFVGLDFERKGAAVACCNGSARGWWICRLHITI